MSNPLIRSVEHFVLLEPEKSEIIVTKEEAIQWLRSWFKKINFSKINESEEFEKKINIADFLENACELEIKQGYIIKWFAVRIDPN